jgi:bile acid:Na+ symporter, BASS family
VDPVLDVVYSTTLLITLWGAGFAVGLSASPAEVASPLKRPSLLLRAAGLDMVAIPVVVWALLQVAGLPQDQEIGLLLVGAAAAGPLGIKASQIAGADVVLAFAVVVLLELSNAVAMPVMAATLMPEGVEVPVGSILGTLLVAVFLPVVAGWGVRARYGRAVEWVKPLTVITNVTTVVAVAAVVVRYWESIVDGLQAGAGWVALVTVVFALVAGWVVGGPERKSRLTLSLVTAIRANALALAVAKTSYPDRPGVTTVIVTFAFVSVFLSLGAAAVFGLAGPSRAAPASE